MSIFKQIKDQVTADIESILEKNEKPFGQHETKYEAESKKLDKQMKQWKQSIEKQRKLEHYFYKEWQDSAQMAEKRQKQLEIAQEADADELIEQASNELAGYEELAREYEESYNEQKERVKKLETRGQELQFLRKKIRRMQLNVIAREEESKLEKGAAKWTYYSEENGVLEEEIEEEAPVSQKEEHTVDFDTRIAELKKEIDNKRKDEGKEPIV